MMKGINNSPIQSCCCILLATVLLNICSICVNGVDVTCYSLDSCLGTPSVANTSDSVCCGSEGGMSYRTTAGHCCSCAEDLEVVFERSRFSVSEGDQFISLAILRCGSFDQEVTISLTFEDVTAQGGIDYGPFPSSILQLVSVVPANASGTEFGINIREDEIVEIEETFSVVLRILSAGGPHPPSNTVVVIEDNDFVDISVEPASFVVMEGEEENLIQFSVRKNGTAVRNVSVIIQSVPNNSSTSDIDYISVRRDLVFPPEVFSLDFSLTILGDDTVETDELVQIVLVEGVGEKGVQFPEGSVIEGTILDDDDTVRITFSQTSYIAMEDSGIATIQLTKEGINERDVTVIVRVNRSRTTATEGLDFNLTITEVEVTFGQEDLNLDFEIAVYREGLYEELESIFLFLEPEPGETAVVVSGMGEVVIMDSDVVVVGFNLQSRTLSESVTGMNVTVELFEGTLDTAVELEVVVVSVDSDLAVEGRDFSLSATTLTFEPNGPRQISFRINPIDDTFFEGREDLTLQLLSSSDRVEIATATTRISLVDNEDLDVRFENSSYLVSENDPYLDVIVSLMAILEREVELDFITTGVRASDGDDFEGVSRTLTFTPTMDTVTVRINLLDDLISEGLEELLVGIFIVDETLGLPGMIQQAEIMIFDNENIFIEFSSSVYSSSEGDNFVALVITKSGETQEDIDVVLSLRDGSARGGIDYGPFPSPRLDLTLTLLSSDTDTLFGVVIREDNIVERLENFTVSISLPDRLETGSNVFIRDISEATVFIVDNDVIVISITPESVQVNEDDQSVEFFIARIDDDVVIDDDLVIDIEVAAVSGSALALQDFAESNTTTTFMFAEDLVRNYSFSLIILEDDLVEGTEELAVTLLVVAEEERDHVFIQRENVPVTIIDNDAVTVRLGSDLYEVVESSGVVIVCLTKDAETSEPLLVLLQPAETTPTLEDTFSAIADTDFNPSNIIVTFQPKDNTACAEISIVTDAISESREVFAVSMSVLETKFAVVMGRPERADVIINDLINVIFGLVTTPLEVPESVGDVTVCLQVLDPPPNVTLNLDVHAVLETIPATADLFDFVFNSTTLVLDDSTRTACLDVEIRNDEEFENLRESFSVAISDFTLSNPRLAGFVTTNATQITIIDDDRVVVVGFVDNSTTVFVGESVGVVNLCVGVLSPGMELGFASEIEVVVETRNGTADDLDFNPLNQELTLQLNSVVRTTCFLVEIIDDDRFEGTPEFFEVEIVVQPFVPNLDLQGVEASPSIARIGIVDDERPFVVGFDQNSTLVVVNEDVGVVVLCVSLMGGSGRSVPPIMVHLDVGSESTAEIQSDFELERQLILLFSDTQRQVCFEVSITDDEIPETDGEDVIVVRLRLGEAGNGDDGDILSLGVVLGANSSVARVVIRDNDELPTTTEVSMVTTVVVATDVVATDVAATDVVATDVAATDVAATDVVATDVAATDVVATDVAATDVVATDVVATDVVATDVAATDAATDIASTDDVATDAATDIAPTDAATDVATDVTTDVATDVATRPTVLTILANDTLLGEDQLYAVPMNLPRERLQLLPLEARGRIPNLCFEIHGDPDTHFNLISDVCTSVNAFYSSTVLQNGYHVVSKIGITAIDSDEQNVFIEIGTGNGCTPIIRVEDSDTVEADRYFSGRISVAKRRNRVRVSVPNCENVQLVMSMVCENVVFLDGVQAIRFDVTRGVNLLPTSHGLLGQFWNVPFEIESYEYDGPTPTYLDVENLFSLTMSHPSSVTRRFVAEYFGRKWDSSRGTCFYAGNLQGGDLLEVTDSSFNDPVIEGIYTEYRVEGLFNNSFTYSQFEGSDYP